MSKGFWAGTRLGQAVQRLSFFPRQRVKKALQTDDERFSGQKLERFVQQDFCLFPIPGHHGRLRSKVDRILVAWILGAPRLNLLARQVVFSIPYVDLHDTVRSEEHTSELQSL